MNCAQLTRRNLPPKTFTQGSTLAAALSGMRLVPELLYSTARPQQQPTSAGKPNLQTPEHNNNNNTPFSLAAAAWLSPSI